MKKIYTYCGALELSHTRDNDTGRTWKGLERQIEAALDEATCEYRAMYRKEYDAICERFNLPAEEKRHEFEVALDKQELASTECYGPDETDTDYFFRYDILQKLFGVEIENEDELDCPVCIRGRIYHHADEREPWVPCEKCNGTGQLTPEQAEEENRIYQESKKQKASLETQF